MPAMFLNRDVGCSLVQHLAHFVANPFHDPASRHVSDHDILRHAADLATERSVLGVVLPVADRARNRCQHLVSHIGHMGLRDTAALDKSPQERFVNLNEFSPSLFISLTFQLQDQARSRQRWVRLRSWLGHFGSSLPFIVHVWERISREFKQKLLMSCFATLQPSGRLGIRL